MATIFTHNDRLATATATAYTAQLSQKDSRARIEKLFATVSMSPDMPGEEKLQFFQRIYSVVFGKFQHILGCPKSGKPGHTDFFNETGNAQGKAYYAVNVVITSLLKDIAIKNDEVHAATSDVPECGALEMMEALETHMSFQVKDRFDIIHDVLLSCDNIFAGTSLKEESSNLKTTKAFAQRILSGAAIQQQTQQRLTEEGQLVESSKIVTTEAFIKNRSLPKRFHSRAKDIRATTTIKEFAELLIKIDNDEETEVNLQAGGTSTEAQHGFGGRRQETASTFVVKTTDKTALLALGDGSKVQSRYGSYVDAHGNHVTKKNVRVKCTDCGKPHFKGTTDCDNFDPTYSKPKTGRGRGGRGGRGNGRGNGRGSGRGKGKRSMGDAQAAAQKRSRIDCNRGDSCSLHVYGQCGYKHDTWPSGLNPNVQAGAAIASRSIAQSHQHLVNNVGGGGTAPPATPSLSAVAASLGNAVKALSDMRTNAQAVQQQLTNIESKFDNM